MNYSDITKAIKSFNVPSGTTKRVSCVACGGFNTLGITNRSGKLSWHCFRASCGIKGKADTTVTISDLKAWKLDAPTTKITLPQHITYVSNPEAMAWLSRYNCTHAISKGYAEVRYDPKEHRLVWLQRDDKGDIIDAAGRALGNMKPKWRRYGNSGMPLEIGPKDSKLAIVVEDAASACAVTAIGATGVALLGTHLQSAALGVLRKYHKCLIALDPDAKLKALSMERLISPHVSTTVVFLPDDPKCFTKDQLVTHLGVYHEAESDDNSGHRG